MPVNYSIATQKDIPSLLPLINSAYRGEASRQGWTTEADIIDGDQRITAADLAEALKIPGAVLFQYKNNKDELQGCVYLKPAKEGLYLGMLSVWPQLQAKGIGKALMKAAEQYASENSFTKITMLVVHVRSELIDWYKRQGYQPTGEIIPFEDGKFGKALIPLSFMVLEKNII
jgi:ribosomal protein S18 acetylase RimI-like enzyme